MNCPRCHRPAKLASDESGDWLCWRCGIWVHFHIEPRRRDTEPAPTLESLELPKPEPLRSDYTKAEIVMPPSNPDEWIITTACEAFGKGYFGLSPDTPVQVRKTVRLSECTDPACTIRPLGTHSHAVKSSPKVHSFLYPKGWQKEDGEPSAFQNAINEAVAEVRRKVEQLVTENRLTDATYEITPDDNDPGKLNVTVRGRSLL